MNDSQDIFMKFFRYKTDHSWTDNEMVGYDQAYKQFLGEIKVEENINLARVNG